MLSTKLPLSNFLKTVLFTAAASLSLNAFAGDSAKGEEKMKELKEYGSKKEKMLNADEHNMLKAKSSLATDEAIEAVEATEDELAIKAEKLAPEN